MIRQLVEFSCKRRVTVLMVALATVAFGLLGFSRLSINLLPSLSYPSLTVQTEFPNAAPLEVEQLITRPVEEAVGVLKGLTKIHSVSRGGLSEVTLEFGWGASMSELAMSVRENLDRLTLPLDAKDSIVLRYDPALDPIVKLSLSGDFSLRQMRLMADKEIKEVLERIPGVASAGIQGGEEEEIHININQGKVAAMGITPSQLAELLSESNINRPGGRLKNTQTQLLIRTLNEYDNLQEIRQLRLALAESSEVRLGDIANVEWSSKEREEITRFNGKEGILISIFKEGDANTLEVANQVKQAINQLDKNLRLPEKIQLDIEFDQSRFIQQSVDEVKQSLLLGGFLAVIILWLFLNNFRFTLIIATAIPLSIVATFIFMYRSDISLNIMSLGGLTLGVGMLVDAAIVVLESIHRQREKGLGVIEATVLGASKVGGAVTASVLTSIAVFLPIIFVEGIAGQLFGEQALTITFSLLASLLIAFTLIPMLASLGQSKSKGIQSTKAEPALVENKTRLVWLSNLYEKFLTKALAFKWGILLLGFIGLILALQLLPRIPTALIPAMSEGEFYFDISLPEGTALPTTNAVIEQMEKQALSHPQVSSVYTSVGSRQVSGGLSLKTKDENIGQVNIVIKERSNKSIEKQVIRDLREVYNQIPQAKTQFGRPSFFSLRTPLELLFFGEDIQQLREYSF